MRAGEATLRHLLEPMAAHLAHDATTEVVVHKPGVVGVEQDGFWSWHDAPSLTYDRLEAIAILAARMGGKNVGGGISTCASTLPDGQRIKLMLPPAVPEGTVSFTIRRRALSFVPTLEWLRERDYFALLNPAVDWVRYFEQDVIGARKTVIICGEIGSSKTTFAEALLRAIPLTQRIVTVESSSEWLNLPQSGWVPTYFDEADANAATNRVQDAMQSRPDWLPFGEIRGGGGDAWALLRAAKVGTPVLTTVHSPNAIGALSSMESMVKQSDAGRGMSTAEIHTQLRLYCNTIVHCRRILPTNPAERTIYRIDEVLEVGATPEQDRMVSAS